MSEEKFERFGKYLILDHLVDGGMAKICRARYLGEQANKIVAVKMVQPQFSKDPAFVKMFEDELKVTFGLVHPNIAQVYDYGMVNDQLYVAMEYVDGANLKQFLDRLREKKYVFPVEISTYIISQVCQALYYAHTFTDKLSAKPFNIIHRDISPHNIMLTYDGAVKVIDFGIAKADSNSEATQAGTIKGKLSYLAPEYLDGLELDPRYDEFAVGITLWEMLCGRKLFKASNDLAVLKQIQACKIPRPSSINPNVPKELDEIVFKVLSKDRSKRYSDLDQLNRALVKFLYSHYPDFNATDLGYFAKQLFKDEIERDHKKFIRYGQIDIRTFLDEMTSEQGEKTIPHKGNATVVTSSEEKTQKSRVIELDLMKKESKEAPDLEFAPAPERTKTVRKKRTASRVSKVTSVGNKTGTTKAKKDGESGKITALRGKHNQTRHMSKTKLHELSKQSTEGSFFDDKKKVYLSAGVAVLLVILLGGYWSGGPQMGGASREVGSATVAMGKVVLVNYDPSIEVRNSGKKVNITDFDLDVPLNEPIRLEVMKKGFKTIYFDEFTLNESDPEISITIPDFEKIKVGLLTTSRNFSPGTKLVFYDGDMKIEKSLPLTNELIPIGSYDAVLVDDLLGVEKKVSFMIEENKKTFLGD